MRRSRAEIYPAGFQTWVDVEQLSRGLEGAYRPGHFRGVATVCLKLFNIVRPQFAYFGQKDAQQIAGRSPHGSRPRPRLDGEVDPDRARSRRPRHLVAKRPASQRPSASAALALPRALETRDPAAARAALDGLEVDYVEIADFDPPVLAAAVRVGSTRLIDNVILNEEER